MVKTQLHDTTELGNEEWGSLNQNGRNECGKSSGATSIFLAMLPIIGKTDHKMPIRIKLRLKLKLGLLLKWPFDSLYCCSLFLSNPLAVDREKTHLILVVYHPRGQNQVVDLIEAFNSQHSLYVNAAKIICQNKNIGEPWPQTSTAFIVIMLWCLNIIAISL